MWHCHLELQWIAFFAYTKNFEVSLGVWVMTKDRVCSLFDDCVDTWDPRQNYPGLGWEEEEGLKGFHFPFLFFLAQENWCTYFETGALSLSLNCNRFMEKHGLGWNTFQRNVDNIRSLDQHQMAAYRDPVLPYEMGGETVKTGNLAGFFWL